jgi:hypothetical protein
VLAHGVHVVAGEVAGDADKARAAPQDLGRGRHPEPVADQVLELGPVVHQPRQVEETLVDDAGVDTTLVLDITDRGSWDTGSELRQYMDYMSVTASWGRCRTPSEWSPETARCGPGSG